MLQSGGGDAAEGARPLGDRVTCAAGAEVVVADRGGDCGVAGKWRRLGLRPAGPCPSAASDGSPPSPRASTSPYAEQAAAG